ncbi:ATP-dependent DNA ligase [Candidatus Woesearchaeota archaeon]|nr:ATP-dependent DNA ligase [Candidatus Woesearchaeota archaeon]
MLAMKADTIQEGFEKAGKPLEAEFKLDGFRVQIHKKGSEIKIFTRRLENVTRQFPEITEYVNKHVKGDNFILDAEAAGYEKATKKYMPFQSISQRIKRKYGIEKMAEDYPVEVNVFDVIAYGSRSLISEPFKKRRELLEKIIRPAERKILPVKNLVTDSQQEIERFFGESKENGNEGLMFKNLNAPYKPGARVGYMLKYKKTMENLDLVIVKAEWGEGKRSKWLSSYTIACRNGRDMLELGKASTGLKEKPEEGLSFEEMTSLLKPLIIREEGKTAFVKPKVVIEVGYEEIQKSPTYESGYALRFPRVIRLRDDRRADDASTLKMVEQYYGEQKKKGN